MGPRPDLRGVDDGACAPFPRPLRSLMIRTMNLTRHVVPTVVATIVAADLALILLAVPRVWTLAATLLVTLFGTLVLALTVGRRARRVQGSTRPRRMA